jgi:Haloacid dehalogenase-like hydrolase
MPRRFDLVVFDWDGTVVDSTAMIARSIQKAAADLDLVVPSLEQASHVIGLGLKDALAGAVPDLALRASPILSCSTEFVNCWSALQKVAPGWLSPPERAGAVSTGRSTRPDCACSSHRHAVLTKRIRNRIRRCCSNSRKSSLCIGHVP